MDDVIAVAKRLIPHLESTEDFEIPVPSTAGRKRMLDHEQIIRLHADGLKDAEIAKIVGCSNSSVSNILSRWRKAQRLKTERVAVVDEGKIWALAFGGWTLKAIAEECGCPVEQAAEIIRKRLPK